MCAKDDQTFWPFTTNVSSRTSMRVRTAARSDPAPGSEKPWHQTSSALRMFARYRDFCSSVPCAMIVGPAIPSPITPRCCGAWTRAISSSTIAWWL